MIKLRDIPENIDDKQRDNIEEHNRVLSGLKQLVKALLDNGNDAEDIAEIVGIVDFNMQKVILLKKVC